MIRRPWCRAWPGRSQVAWHMQMDGRHRQWALGYVAAARGEWKRCALLQAHVETWAKEWELSTGEERALYLAAAEVMRASKKKRAGPADGYRLTLKALASFEVTPLFWSATNDAGPFSQRGI